MLPSASIRSAQFELRTLPLQLSYLELSFKRLASLGYNTVFLQYGDTFPFQRHRALRGPLVYTESQVKEIDRMAGENGLEIISSSYSFSHAELLIQRAEYSHLAEVEGGDCLCLSNPAAVDIMIEIAREMHELHPRSRFVHLGGDEMAALGLCPACAATMWETNKSALLVQYLNAVAVRLRHEGIRPAIWSDMLIKNPQSLDQLSRDYLIYYWDYWGSGPRQPYVSIGGGFSDMFVLDKEALEGDLKVMMRHPAVRRFDEMPSGLEKIYAEYWELDSERKSVKSFPYLRFFVDHQFDVIAAALPYAELGSILPNYSEKWPHLTHFVERVHETGAAGGSLCHWVPHWPLLETLWLGIVAFGEGLAHGVAKMEKDRVFDKYTKLLFDRSLPEFASAVYHVARRFEFGDTLTPFWQERSLSEKVDWHRKSRLLDKELQNVEEQLQWIEPHLKVFREYQNENAHARAFAILAEETALKLKREYAMARGKEIDSAGVELETLSMKLRNLWAEYHTAEAVEMLCDMRVKPFLRS